ncbi:aspartic proteinase CDR1-like [Olea europaea var. sylvestris]|uniref:Aspartic ase CDR1-like n=1 Tax=Olea europaea subsp. europaea TaxID=158383 RepID=A0A8S0R2X9_OLEEU|nr:aspartic proteinase CDR1-like [Olea europaea var. sylvestris]CAA2972704.1 aspartic ase CDR1-like [Olea europaea subsp. europaea]
MAFHSNFFFTLLVSCSVISLIDASNDGITVDLIYRDSRLSPFYNPNKTQFERLDSMFSRSLARKAFLNPTSISTTDSIEAVLKSSGGEYLMKISIGTPPVEILVMADTGSDLLWTQCLPCETCEQNAPLFDPRKSTSYSHLPYSSNLCRAVTAVGHASRDHEDNCRYSVSYRDDSYSKGDLATETISLQSNSGKSVSYKVAFGCGHDNRDTSNEADAGNTGIIGLGGGSLSLVRQLYKSIGGTFSYCLTQIDEYDAPSKISFGSDALVLGPKVVSTPLIIYKSYYIRLEGVTVGTNRLNYEPPSGNGFPEDRGYIIIDSGTMLTFFFEQFYLKLESALVEVIKGERVKETPGDFKLCYRTSRGDFDAPKIVVHFSDADLELSSTNTFLEVKGMLCLTMVPSNDKQIFGNLNQMDYLVGYDLVNNKVSFKPTDCSKFP